MPSLSPGVWNGPDRDTESSKSAADDAGSASRVPFRMAREGLCDSLAAKEEGRAGCLHLSCALSVTRGRVCRAVGAFFFE